MWQIFFGFTLINKRCALILTPVMLISKTAQPLYPVPASQVGFGVKKKNRSWWRTILKLRVNGFNLNNDKGFNRDKYAPTWSSDSKSKSPTRPSKWPRILRRIFRNPPPGPS
jgi:hypothetical protein